MRPLLLRLKCHNKCTKEAPSCRISFLPSKPCMNPDPVGKRTYVVWHFQFFPSSRQNSEDWIRSIGYQQSSRPTAGSAAVRHTTKGHHEKSRKPLCICFESVIWGKVRIDLYIIYYIIYYNIYYIYYIFDSLYFMFGYAWGKSRIVVLTHCLRNVLNTFIGDLHLIEVTADPIRIILQCWTSWIPAATRPPPPRPRLPLQHPSSRAIPPVPRHHPTPHPKATGTAASTFQVGVMIQSAVYIKCV